MSSVDYDEHIIQVQMYTTLRVHVHEHLTS